MRCTTVTPPPYKAAPAGELFSPPPPGGREDSRICSECVSRYPEDIGGEALVLVLGIGPGVLSFSRDELGAVLLEAVGDVLQKDEAEDDMLLFGRVHVVVELIGSERKLRLESEIGRGILG